jgi:hypothetical protein
MKFNKTKSFVLLGLLYASAIYLPSLKAQEEIPQPTPTAEEISRKQRLISKLGFARLWYFAPADAPRITVCLKASGATTPRVIGSFVRPGSVRDYRVMPPGRHELLVLDGTIIPDNQGKVAVPEKKLTPPIQIDLEPGKFQTILVKSIGGNFTCEILEDKAPTQPDQMTFRIFDFTASKKEALQLIANQRISTLWNSGNPNPTERMVPAFSGPARIELLNLTSATPVPVNSYEMEGTPASAYSLVMYIDRYGQKSISLTRDAFVDLDEQEAKSFAAGSGL